MGRACTSAASTREAIVSSRESGSTSLSRVAASSLVGGRGSDEGGSAARGLAAVTRKRSESERRSSALGTLLIARDVRAPGLGANRLAGLPHHRELPLPLHLADHHRLPEVVVGLVHLQ